VQYEHFDPPFEEAFAHRAEGIALLCGACHDRKTRGLLSPITVAQSRQSPTTFRNGSSRDAFDLKAPFTLRIGSSVVENVSSIVRTHEGERWFSIQGPEEADAPMRLSAQFFDDHGSPTLTLDENEWITSTSPWDVDIIGNAITVRRGPGEITLMIEACPPHELILKRLKMHKLDLAIEIKPSGKTILRRDGGVTEFGGNVVSSADCVFLI